MIVFRIVKEEEVHLFPGSQLKWGVFAKKKPGNEGVLNSRYLYDEYLMAILTSEGDAKGFVEKYSNFKMEYWDYFVKEVEIK